MTKLKDFAPAAERMSARDGNAPGWVLLGMSTQVRIKMKTKLIACAGDSVPAGTFHGDLVPAGTFHGDSVPPGTFHAA